MSQGFTSRDRNLIVDVIQLLNLIHTNSIKFTSNSRIRSEFDFSFEFRCPLVKVFNAEVVPNSPFYLWKNSHNFLRCLGNFPDFLLASVLIRSSFPKIINLISLTGQTRQPIQPTKLNQCKRSVAHRSATVHSFLQSPSAPARAFPHRTAQVPPLAARPATPCLAVGHCRGPAPMLQRKRGSRQASLDQHGLQPGVAAHSPNPRRPRVLHLLLVATAAVPSTHRVPCRAQTHPPFVPAESTSV
jgi:hypothetical protein